MKSEPTASFTGDFNGMYKGFKLNTYEAVTSLLESGGIEIFPMPEKVISEFQYPDATYVWGYLILPDFTKILLKGWINYPATRRKPFGDEGEYQTCEARAYLANYNTSFFPDLEATFFVNANGYSFDAGNRMLRCWSKKTGEMFTKHWQAGADIKNLGTGVPSVNLSTGQRENSFNVVVLPFPENGKWPEPQILFQTLLEKAGLKERV